MDKAVLSRSCLQEAGLTKWLSESQIYLHSLSEIVKWAPIPPVLLMLLQGTARGTVWVLKELDSTDLAQKMQRVRACLPEPDKTLYAYTEGGGSFSCPFCGSFPFP